jgi:hypothetical protein
MQDVLVLLFFVGLLVYLLDVVKWAIPYYWKVYQFWKLVRNNNNNNDDHQPTSIFDDVEMSDTLQQQQQQQLHTEYVQWNDETPFMPHTTIATTPTSARKVEHDFSTMTTLDSLPLELTARHIIPFVGDYQYRFVGSVNRKLHHAYSMTFPSKQTYVNMSTIPHSKICWNESTLSSPSASPMFWRVAVRHGNLLVLQYLKSMGFAVDDDTCAIAAEYGHLDIYYIGFGPPTP